MQARWKIVQKANEHIMNTHKNSIYVPTMIGMRNLQRAVNIVRQGMLVSGTLLMEAGFKPHAAKPGKPTVIKRLLGEK